MLFLTRFYPPEVSGGARRPFLLTQALRALGHKVTLVTPFRQDNDPDTLCVPHPIFGDTPLKRNPDDNEQAAPLAPATPLRNFARQWALWPDPEIRWCRAASRAVLASGLRPDWLITTSPPESSHLAGRKIATTLNVPWLAEFRDTWVDLPHRAVLANSKPRAFIERKIAKWCLTKADAVSCVSPVGLDEMRHYVRPGTPEILIDHFSTPPPPPRALPDTDLNLVHTGGFTLSDRRRQIGPLLESLAKAAHNRKDLHLHLAGRLTPAERAAAQSPRTFKVTLYGEIPLSETQALQAGADGLILYTPENSHALPGKFAEYCFAQRPILFLGSGDWQNLLKDPAQIQPLDHRLADLQKNEKTAPSDLPDAATAATKLIAFLETVQNCDKK